MSVTEITWFGGNVGVMRLSDWTLHLLDGAKTFCGKAVARRVTALEADSDKCRWCEVCFNAAQRADLDARRTAHSHSQ